MSLTPISPLGQLLEAGPRHRELRQVAEASQARIH